MAASSDDFDVETMAPPAKAAANYALRATPRVSWTDAAGTHEKTIERRVVAGSAPVVDLVIADPTVSRLHVELVPQPDGVWVRDLGSRNGTFVGDLLVREGRLGARGTLRIGQTSLTVETGAARRAVDLWPEETFQGLVGRSVVMRELFARLALVGPSDATVLIEGETGTGKELVAEALHAVSPRKERPFLVVDCGALPDTLLEAELFGHAKGAFTGASAARAGVFEAADGGTVFLDEIGELPLALQPKLLRALESRTVRRLGEAHYRKVDIRAVAATHRDLAALVNSGAFREDLYFRLEVVPVTVPPLRARPDDVSLLVEHFTRGRASAEIVNELVAATAGRLWPGNVRELRNFVERGLLLGTPEAMALAGPRAADQSPRGFPPVPTDVPLQRLRDEWLGHLEREYVNALMQQHGGDTAAVARAAGIDRSSVYRIIRRHRL